VDRRRAREHVPRNKQWLVTGSKHRAAGGEQQETGTFAAVASLVRRRQGVAGGVRWAMDLARCMCRRSRRDLPDVCACGGSCVTRARSTSRVQACCRCCGRRVVSVQDARCCGRRVVSVHDARCKPGAGASRFVQYFWRARGAACRRRGPKLADIRAFGDVKCMRWVEGGVDDCVDYVQERCVNRESN
jgi:hypothetical protein